MNIDVVMLPALARSDSFSGRAVVVFDVLRATTTMPAALAAGVREIRVFPDLETVRTASRACLEPHLTCGEARARKPDGFDLGNSPGALNPTSHKGQLLLMCTTNGTRAVFAARSAAIIFVAALVNASAAARAIVAAGLDVTLLCAGTDGEVSIEDVLGAGAVIDAAAKFADVTLISDSARIARAAHEAHRHDLLAALTSSQGGQNVMRAGLEADIAFAARLDVFDAVGVVRGEAPIVRRWDGSV